MKSLLPILLLLLFTLNTAFSQPSNEEDRVIEILAAFEQAIIDNDREAASKLLAEEIRIVEGSAIETKEEYLSHHFHSDGNFLREMERTTDDRTIFTEGSVAWATTKTHIRGTYNDRELNLSSMELAVLRKENDQWKIAALHWSSSARK